MSKPDKSALQNQLNSARTNLHACVLFKAHVSAIEYWPQQVKLLEQKLAAKS